MLKAKFEADFSEFQNAVVKAEVQLKSFEAGAGKVSASLGKMANSLSGTKLLSDATIATEAVARMGGAATLTEREQAKVNRTVTEALAKYAALGKDAPPAMLALANATKAVEQPTSRVNSFIGDLTNQVKATALGFISAQAAIGGVKAAFSGLTAFIGSSVDSFAAAEAAQKKLTTAMRAQGTATPDVTAQYDKLATQFQRTTVFSDDLVTEMQALLVQVGNVMPREMDSALRASTDLASGLGIDLRQATMLVGKAFEGETGTLKRYGIVIDEAKLKAGGMPVVLDAIQARFGGQASAEVETYAGKVKQLANEWDNLQEAVGRTIVTDPFINMLIAKAKEHTTALAEAQAATEKNQDAVLNLEHGIVALGIGYISASNNVRDMVTVLGAYITAADSATASSQKLAGEVKQPALFTGGAGGPAKPTGGPDPAVLVAQWTKEQAKAEAATKAAAEAAKQAAKAFREMADAMSGEKAIQEANKQLELIAFNMNRGIPLAKMTRENQDAINKSMAEAMTVYRLMGTEVPPAVRAVYFATLDVGKGIPIVAGLSAEYARLGSVIGVTASEAGRMVPIVSGLTAEFGKMGAIVNVAQQAGDDAGDAFGDGFKDAMQATLEDVGVMIIRSLGNEAAMEQLGGNIGSMVGAGIGGYFGGPVGAAIGDKIGGFFGTILGKDEQRAVNNRRDEFLGTFGTGGTGAGSGFRTLADQLHAAGVAGDALFQKLIRTEDMKAFQRAVAEVNAALDKQKDVAAAAGKAAGVAGEAQIAATNKALDAITAMDDELKSLFKSIENEAPEEIMGVIEANTRAQIAGIQKERDAAQLALEQTAGDAAKTAEEAAKLIEQTLGAHDFRVKVKIDLDDPSGILSGKTAGGILRGGTSGTSGTAGSGGSGSTQPIVVENYFDGELLAQSLVTTLKRQGVK